MKKISLTLITFLFSFLSIGIGYSAPININRADIPTILENLTNIGPVKAQAIIDYREKNGPFQSLNDLLKVKGIGAKTIEHNKDNILFESVTNTDDAASAISANTSQSTE